MAAEEAVSAAGAAGGVAPLATDEFVDAAVDAVDAVDPTTLEGQDLWDYVLANCSSLVLASKNALVHQQNSKTARPDYSDYSITPIILLTFPLPDRDTEVLRMKTKPYTCGIKMGGNGANDIRKTHGKWIQKCLNMRTRF